MPPAEPAKVEARAPESKPPVIDRKPMPPASAAPGASTQVASTPAAEATRALFVANCAQCHGEKGDGEGVTQLDRKARSFLDGGFSYGNTQDAILRSITHGIPGTPMPAFEKALNEAQRADLARYVIAFGPDQIVVDPSESEMVVKDRPLVVRGKLPAIVEGAEEWPRGLAIGTPDGLTFEYRTDDVQLVGVRAGRFVNRSDWGERGGTALEMLGQVVLSFRPQWSPALLSIVELGDDGLPADLLPRHAQLVATEVQRNKADVEYRLTGGTGAEQRSALVREHCGAFRNRFGSGIRVTSSVRADEGSTFLAIGDLQSTSFGLQTGKGSIHSGPPSTSTSNRPYLIVLRASSELSRMRALRHSEVLELPADKEVTVDVYVLTDLTTSVDLQDTAQLAQLFQEFDL